MTNLTLLDNFLIDYCSIPGRFLDVGGAGMSILNTIVSLGHQYDSLNLGSGTYDITDDPWHWKMIPDNTYDYVISITVFEHIEFPWLTFLEMVRVVKENGLLYIIAPSQGGYHQGYLDCWRILPDGMRALAKWGKVNLIKTNIDPTSGGWQYCEGLFKKER